MLIDARIPVRFAAYVPQPSPAAALIVGAGSAPSVAGWAATLVLPPAGAHPVACACCGGRPAWATALTHLFQARARGEVGFFRALVVCLPDDQAVALRDLLAADPYLSGCFVAAAS
ncbi:hypothetical protein [Lichenicoccus sp.]|uniref:hypothetical protein n=1 Tax=Lichenicoccus sp. TaxID=2781899 RepID=UPI003D0D2805